jgi:hypothetical protein
VASVICAANIISTILATYLPRVVEFTD